MQKYKCRIQVTNTAAMLRAERGEKDDVLAWEFLNQVITTLGSDRMSSDESGQEDMEPVFFTRAMPWRRDITKELKIIDTSCYLDSDILSPQGAKRAKRIRSTNPTSRKAVRELPRQLYSPTSLEQDEGIASKESLLWMSILMQMI
ncbi:hypothetical protein BU15DRAFT_66404 [Melanogaster broomeanus]|nr:hypothetical protein BU15DRAFT_66404 [Melanogaster broomeanus]